MLDASQKAGTRVDRGAAPTAPVRVARATIAIYRADVLPRIERACELQLAKYREMAAAYPAVLQAQRTDFLMTEQYLDAVNRAWAAASALRSALAAIR